MLTWHRVLSPRMGMWFGLAETNRTGFFVCFLGFLQWKLWSGENCVDALVSGEEHFLDLGKIFLPYSLSSGYLSNSGLPWLQKVLSFWPFLSSGDSCCCSPVESPSSCLHRERVTPSDIPARIRRAGDRRACSERCGADGAGMWPGWTKRLFLLNRREWLFPGT